jgi:hypothetical protein
MGSGVPNRPHRTGEMIRSHRRDAAQEIKNGKYGLIPTHSAVFPDSEQQLDSSLARTAVTQLAYFLFLTVQRSSKQPLAGLRPSADSLSPLGFGVVA